MSRSARLCLSVVLVSTFALVVAASAFAATPRWVTHVKTYPGGISAGVRAQVSTSVARAQARYAESRLFAPVPGSTYFKAGFAPVGNQTCIPLPITETDNNPNFKP